MAPFHQQAGNLSSSVPAQIHASSWSQASVQPRPSAGRKRSRDEASVNLNDDIPPTPVPIEPIKETEEDWIYGEGMVLIKPGSGYVADASSQSGTWVEERAAEEEKQRTETAAAAVVAAALQQQRDRPLLRSYKSQRLEQSTMASPGQEVPTNPPSPGTNGIANSPFGIPTLSNDAGAHPVVDDFTLHLGIGWRRISDDEHIQAAARGWARYIENHYPINSVSIRLESKGLQSYLVESAEGFFLFSEDLKQGRLVSKTVEDALARLKCSPPVFDGPETMEAAETPKPAESPRSVTPSGQADVDMDMS